MYFSLSIHEKGGFITNLYRTSIHGVSSERNAINRIQNLFPRVHLKKKKYSQTQYSKRKGNRCEIEHYIKTFENSKSLGFCSKCKNSQGVIIWPKSTTR